MKGDLFKGIVQWDMPALNPDLGKSVFKLPVFYYDNTSMTAIYTASTEKIRQYLPHPSLHPAEMYPGRCLLAFTAFEYRKTDIDPYNEFSISILITMGKKGIPGLSILSQMRKKCYSAFVWHLPVTTEIARWGGVELYNYPKFIAGINFTRTTDSIICDLSEKGEHILTLKGPLLKTAPGPVARYKTYPVRQGVPLCGNVYVSHLDYVEKRNPKGVELTLGSGHTICKELAGVDLGEKAVLYQYSADNEAVLFGPRNLIDD